MAEVAKVLYILVHDDGEKNSQGKESFRYTRPVLQSTLQFMGCKARHAFKISKRVFEVMGTKFSRHASLTETMKMLEDVLKRQTENEDNYCTGKVETEHHLHLESDDVRHRKVPFELYMRRTTVAIRRETFLDAVCAVLAEYKYVGPNQRADLILACRIREKKESVTMLLCGTSGCGKSTLSALLGSRLGVTTVISTDSIRHMMRGFADEKQNPLLWSSTYHAGEYLDQVAVAKAKAKKRAKKDEVHNGPTKGEFDPKKPENVSTNDELIGPKELAIAGYKAQSEMVIDGLDRLITAWEERKESVVVEGVHLSLNFVMGLMKKHPSVIPFMIYITNEEKHLERFAVRAKYMALDPAKNKYVKYIRNIRAIQDYLCNRADKHLVPKINNTNVDKSVAAIHATVFSCLRRRDGGEQLYDPAMNTVSLVNEEYRNQCVANSLSSKGMFQLIQGHGCGRRLMALLNTDGSVARAWPVDSMECNGKSIMNLTNETGLIGKAETVNIQFGLFGISAWASDSCGTSHASSIDGSRADGTETGSRYYSSCCSSPRISEGHAKELKEEQSVDGSDEEEVYLPGMMGSDDDLSDVGDKPIHHEEMEGSVDEDSTKSDEEYEDLAMQDMHEDGSSWKDDEDDNNNNNKHRNLMLADDNGQDQFLTDKDLKNEKSVRTRRHCSTVPALGSHAAPHV